MQPAGRRHGLVLDHVCARPGYVDPAYVRSGGVSHKSDVYSLGVVLFENFILDKPLLAKLAKSHYENGKLNGIILPSLQKQTYSRSLKEFTEAAYCCLNEKRTQRPNIDRAMFALEQALELQLTHENSSGRGVR
ncbi:hypothetical protein QVD17_15797 [Tagetes erecta]|uniref:Protein kinase domain-containing protein n=1 Tax=Tagetes erecta TaxID=13708 RepID=A0AAD8P002_TARER|nr:hypothetical protein QVD17_15797 [Tagetes erecta]